LSVYDTAELTSIFSKYGEYSWEWKSQNQRTNPK
jgi:hypothetical protein